MTKEEWKLQHELKRVRKNWHKGLPMSLVQKNTSSNNKYTAPQATPKSCPKCNDTAIIKYLDDGKYGCENCAYVWT